MARLPQLLLALFAACSASPPPAPPAVPASEVASSPRSASPPPASTAPLDAVAAVVPRDAVVAEPAPTGDAGVAVSAPEPPSFEAWLRGLLPPGAELRTDGGEVSVEHVVQRGDTAASIAKAYFPLTNEFFLSDYTDEIVRAARRAKVAIHPGERLPIPSLVTEPWKTADAERLGWPEDGILRGLYIRGPTAVNRMFPQLLEQMALRDINAIVLDAKDYDGPVTYVSSIPLVVETKAARGAAIPDLSRVVRLVHKKGVRVIMRVSCFDDELMSKAKPKLSVQSKWGRPYPIGWLDPSNPESQDYILALVQESLDAGADEIQLDYVRFPVLGIKGADFHLVERNLTKIQVIRDFVRRAHALTSAKRVPLSLDVFGVIAQGKREDIEALGQDLAILAPEVEVISPMVYPSHYATGFNGFEKPGDHPEVVGIGVKGSLEQMKSAVRHEPGGKLAVIRPWIQAEAYKVTDYTPRYLQEEIRSSDKNGGVGWLMWNPQQEYSYAWAAIPVKRRPGIPVGGGAAVSSASSAAVKSTTPRHD